MEKFLNKSIREEFQKADVKEIGKTSERGTIVKFTPDKEIFYYS